MQEQKEFIAWDHETKIFKILNKNKIDPQLKPWIGEDGQITIPTVFDVINELYPYIDLKIKDEVIQNSIQREACVRKILIASILKKTKTIPVIYDECDDKFHQQLAKRIITEMNQIIYKYNIKKIHLDTILWSIHEKPIIGAIPFIFESDNGVLLVDIRTGMTNFEERTAGILFLYEKLLTENTKLKVLKKILINPRWDICIQEAENPSKSEIWKLLN